MEDLFSLLVFAFFLWSMLGGLFGKKKGAPPQQRHPGRAQHPFPDDRAAGSEHGPSPRSSARHGEAESAAEMIPDDLWAILTGETRRPAPRPEPRGEPEWEAGHRAEPRWEDEPAPPPEPEFEPWWESEPEQEPRWEPAERATWEEDEASEEEEVTVVATRSYEETLARRQREPEIVSLETPPPPTEIRHARFHERIDALREADAERRARQQRRSSAARQRSLRRAMVLREVLGPPKGLE